MKSTAVQIAFIAVVILLTGPVTAAPSPSKPEYRLRFFPTHTGETLDVVYRDGDSYVPEALAELDHFLRDHRTGEGHTMTHVYSTFFMSWLNQQAGPEPAASSHLTSVFRHSDEIPSKNVDLMECFAEEDRMFKIQRHMYHAL